MSLSDGSSHTCPDGHEVGHFPRPVSALVGGLPGFDRAGFKRRAKGCYYPAAYFFYILVFVRLVTLLLSVYCFGVEITLLVTLCSTL